MTDFWKSQLTHCTRGQGQVHQTRIVSQNVYYSVSVTVARTTQAWPAVQVLTDPELGAEEDDEDGGDPGEAGQEDDEQQQRAAHSGQDNKLM